MSSNINMGIAARLAQAKAEKAIDPKVSLDASIVRPSVALSRAAKVAVAQSAFTAIADPMMALIAATHARTQIAMGELSELAEDQQAANDRLEILRKLEGKVREMRADGKIDASEIQRLKEISQELEDLGLGSIDALVDTLEKGLVNGEVVVNKNGDEAAQGFDANMESIKEELASAKDTVRGEVSNRELDMQRMTQEVSSAMQLQSNLSKRWNDVANAIIGNMRG